ncbi:putative methyl-coenzyme M reductase II subunit gamma [Thalictrum thalictroides]|uniref:Putative methyl-coenzyme M reductase II subunit gamma n=1 Tax=Thalictrum thalictroides TaxID=46969 RepID=A0A7J6XE80_THATH|nr:putative methyl-coenzyme M reductase II subunit gamma [Thalictrum thalictroides]
MERFQQHNKRYHQGNGEISSYQCYESSKVKSLSRPKSIRTRGNLQFRRRVEDLEIVSDTSSCSSYSIEEDSFSYKLRRTTSRQSSEAPMKKLLEEELSREMETRRRPPSVIARLMGLDALPPQQPIKRQQKKFSENYQKKTASIGYLDKRSSYEGRSSRRSNSQPEEFKDVFEVSESSMSKKHPNLLQEGMANLRRNENELEFVRQTFMDVKRFSTDEKLQQSKEYHDALDVLYSNKDLLLKFLQEPDSLFTKHLHDLHDVPSPPQPGHIRVLQSSNAHGNLRTKIGKSSEQSHGSSSIQKHEQGITHRKNVYIPSKVSKSRAHEKDDTCQLPTRIVVLKPNLKKVQNAVRPLSSPESTGGFHSGHRKKKKFGSSENFDSFQDVEHQRDSTFDVELVKHTTRGSREIAREITRQMRHSLSSGSKMVPSMKLKGYAGDESSCSLSGNESANDSEEMTTTSRYFNDLKNRYSPSSSYSTESSVSREAKKRLSERWKMTHRSQEVRKATRGSTLGEMLALPDRETVFKSYDSVGPDAFSDNLSRNGVTRCATPLGISSRDGWKDECVRSLPRSRSLPASSTCLNSPKTSIRYRTPGKDRCALPNESINWHSNISRKLDSEQRDGFLLRSNTKSFRKTSSYSSCAGEEENQLVQVSGLKPDEQIYDGGEKSHLVQDTDLNWDEQRYQCGDLVLDAGLKPDQSRLSLEGVDLSEWRASIIDIPVNDPLETTTSVNERELSAENSNPENTPIHSSEGSSIFSQCPTTEVESPASSKEAGQPSPISVLEPPFVEESSSSSDSFEKISADLHGLRMQLQLLKLESSDAYSEGSEMIVSSDEDIRDGCRDLPREIRGLNICDKVNRDFSYMVDVLVDSGINDADLDVLSQAWYSPECPILPSVFDELEKKYGEQTTWPRSDRRLLFDRINMGLTELLLPHMDPHPWVRLGKPIGLQWKVEHLAEELWTLVVRQCNEVKKISPEMALMNEMKWSDFGDDINTIGNGIEKLLFDELMTEVVIT